MPCPRLRGFCGVFVSFLAPVSPASAGSVSGLVHAKGTPIADARVTVFMPSLSYFAETRSLADGMFALNGVRLEYHQPSLLQIL